jgi:urocanate hydratase
MQSQTLRAFTILHQLHPKWGGSLILNIGLNPEGSALALASNIAGAVCLTLEPDPAIARAALRTGACDFVVNTLDEALRALKNEVRQKRPLSVGLEANPSSTLQELLARGVAPQLVATTITDPALTVFQSEGTPILSLADNLAIPGAINTANLLNNLLYQTHWTPHDLTFSDTQTLRDFDTRALALVPDEDTLRRTWLTSAPRLFSRERPPHRVLYLTPGEQAQLEKK